MSRAVGAVGRQLDRINRVPALPSALAVLLALVVGGLMIIGAGGEPISAYGALLNGAFGSPAAFGRMLVQAVPLVIIGLGIALCFRARVYNIGAEGQLFMGALFGGAAAILLPIGSSLPLILAALAAGILGGAFWGWIVGFLLSRWQVNEVITSLLLSFVAILAFTYVIRRPLRDPEATAGLGGKAVPDAALLPDIGFLQAHIGIVIALLLVPLVAYLMYRTPFGFRVRMMGANREAAEVAGVRTGRMAMSLMLISGGLAGLAGVIQILGVSERLDPNLSPGYGFTAIVVALIGRLDAFGVLIGALILAVLTAGGQAMSVTEGLPYSLVLAIQGVFIIFVLIADRSARS